MQPQKNTTCNYCGWSFNTKSNMQKVTCPSCQNKTPAKNKNSPGNTNIEDTIFNDALPINPYPMVTRLQQLLDDCRNNRQDWKQDKRIEKLMWLLNATYLNSTIGNFDLSDWWGQLNAQNKGAHQAQTH